MELYVPTYDKLGTIPMRVGPNVPAMAPNSLYPTADANWVLIAANSNQVFARLARVMERDDLTADPRFVSIRARGAPENTRALDAIVGAWTVRFEAKALEAMLGAAEVPNARVYTIADIFEDPHYAARDMLLKVAHPVLGTTVQAGVIPKLSRTPGAVRGAGPEIGADTRAVLREAGLTEQQIEALIAKNVVKAP
jgi:crotonobetainyl-CoA:carnitine CoA-transferase CaiB-like acyl-CoA transferase